MEYEKWSMKQFHWLHAAETRKFGQTELNFQIQTNHFTMHTTRNR